MVERGDLVYVLSVHRQGKVLRSSERETVVQLANGVKVRAGYVILKERRK